MAKRKALGVLLVLLLAASVSGCDKIVKKEKDSSEFVRGPEGLIMSFVPNYPQDKFIVSKPKQAGEGEPISVLVEVRNKGTYPPEGVGLESGSILTFEKFLVKAHGQEYVNTLKEAYGSLDAEQVINHKDFGLKYKDYLKEFDNAKAVFGLGAIHLSGFDTSIIQMDKLSQEIGNDKGDFILYLPAASSVNPLGGIDTAEFDGKIVVDNILIESYNPTILVTACYPYFTKSTPTVCIDPEPFDSRQEKVCAIGSQAVQNQGAPIAVTRIDQEAAAGKIQFKISIKNVGNGDVIWNESITRLPSLLDACNPNKGGKLDRKHFDRVQLEKVKIGGIDLMRVDDPATTDKVEAYSKCAPFADGTNNLVRLFNGEGFVICTLDVDDLGDIQSAYTTPIDIELRYAYRSTISKPIQIKKLETVGG